MSHVRGKNMIQYIVRTILKICKSESLHEKKMSIQLNVCKSEEESLEIVVRRVV